MPPNVKRIPINLVKLNFSTFKKQLKIKVNNELVELKIVFDATLVNFKLKLKV